MLWLLLVLPTTAMAQFVPDSLCTVDTLHWEPNPVMQARHAAVLNDRNAIQLEAAKRCGYDKALTFEFSHFMSPQSAYLQAGHLYDRYREYFGI